MANIASIHGDPIGALKHDLRERTTYKNEDIDPERSSENYIIQSHGKNSGEIYSYYHSLVDGVYHRGKGSVLNDEIIVTAPDGLSPEKRSDFFEGMTACLNDYLFNGDTSRVLLSVVHNDEAGAPHMHYAFTHPEVKNEHYISAEEKFTSGIKYLKEELDISPTKEQTRLLAKYLNQYSRTRDENSAIHGIADSLTLSRDDARKVFLRIRRTERESMKTRLMSRDEFLTKKVYDNLHPTLQKYVDEHGPKCTVFNGGGKINLTVQQLKAYTARTGKTVSKEVLKNLTVDKVLDALEKEHSRIIDAWGKENAWGDKERGNSWERDY